MYYEPKLRSLIEYNLWQKMAGQDFVNKWKNSINYLNLPTVGIHVSWNLIAASSRVVELQSEEAWRQIYKFTPPWFKSPKTFGELIDKAGQDYKAIVLEEILNGKIARMTDRGLEDPNFCAFAGTSSELVILGDGNHRFLNCNFLMWLGKDFDSDIQNTKLDVIHLDNFEEVIKPQTIWPEKS